LSPVNHIYLSDPEWEEARALAEQEGRSVDEVASEMVQKTIARRFKRNTGKTPAKVYSLPKKKKP
jgi:transcriptional regulator GlxA family with amidase domain